MDKKDIVRMLEDNYQTTLNNLGVLKIETPRHGRIEYNIKSDIVYFKDQGNTSFSEGSKWILKHLLFKD